MGLVIRDDTVRDMAKRLAEAHRTTVTEAVRRALVHQLAKLGDDRAERDRRIRELSAELDAMPRRPYADEDLHDELGCPK